jgi:hypothetical protein
VSELISRSAVRASISAVDSTNDKTPPHQLASLNDKSRA